MTSGRHFYVAVTKTDIGKIRDSRHVRSFVALSCSMVPALRVEIRASDRGDDRWRRVTPDEAASVLPVNEWTSRRGMPDTSADRQVSALNAACPRVFLVEPVDDRHMTSWTEDRIGSAQRDENPTVLARLPAGFAVIGDVQWLPGYCVLLVDDSAVTRLSDMPKSKRVEFLSSMDTLGEAVELACAAADAGFRRVNLEILGNTDAYLHAHVWPRYEWEPPELVRYPVWRYPDRYWTDPATALGPQHDALRRAVREHLRAYVTR